MKRYVVKSTGELAEHRSGTLITWHDHVTAITAVEDERDRLREALIEQAKATAHEALVDTGVTAECARSEWETWLCPEARAAITKARGEG